jgi:hypothetical protein
MSLSPKGELRSKPLTPKGELRSDLSDIAVDFFTATSLKYLIKIENLISSDGFW